jgi:hypothetical protein
MTNHHPINITEIGTAFKPPFIKQTYYEDKINPAIYNPFAAYKRNKSPNRFSIPSGKWVHSSRG